MTQVMPGDSVVKSDRLPDGVTPELAARMRAVVVELDSLGLAVILATADSRGKVVALAKGDAHTLSTLVIAVVPTILTACPCPICQTSFSVGSARA